MGAMVEPRRHRKDSPDQGSYVPPPSRFGSGGFKAFTDTAKIESTESPKTKGLSVVDVVEKIEISEPPPEPVTFNALIQGDIEFVPAGAVPNVDPDLVDDDPALVTRTSLRRSEKRRRLLLMTAFVVLAVLIVAGMFLLWWSMQTPTEIIGPGPSAPVDDIAEEAL